MIPTTPKTETPDEVASSAVVCDEPPQAPQYRLVLSHGDWPRPTRTKWQASRDFSNALAKAAELGVTAEIECSHTKHISGA